MKPIFQLTDLEWQRAQEFIESRPSAPGTAIGGQFVYTFCETTIGCIVRIIDQNGGESRDLTDYELF